MGDDQRAPMQRIEAALARIDRAATRQRAALNDLRHRHGALRNRMSEAITALDSLLGEARD